MLKNSEYREIQRIARARHLPLSEWVRQALDLARRGGPQRSIGKKLEVIRAAARHNFLSGGIAQMLSEIESSKLVESRGQGCE